MEGKVKYETAQITTTKQVISDLLEREQMGILKYGTTPDKNPLSLLQWLQHAYEETLDKAIYLKRAMQEIHETETMYK